MHDGGNKAIVAALLANFGIAVAKFIGFGLTGASSMLAEGVHSLADTGNQGLLLFGGAQAKRRATDRHPFGYGMERYFWAFVVSIVIFLLGGLFALYEGIHKLSDPSPIASPGIALSILGVGILLEGWSFRTAVVEANRRRLKRSWWVFIRDTKNAELPVVLLEDLGALIGLVTAAVGVSAAAVTGDGRFDAIGSIAIGVLLCIIAVVLSIEMRSLLVGEAAAPDVHRKIVSAFESTEGVIRVIHVRTMHLGPEELLVCTKIDLSADLSFVEVTDVIDAAEANVRAGVPSAKLIYVEPDVYERKRDPRLNDAPITP